MSFQSTRPIRGATIASGNIYQTQIISIHAPHTGRDCALTTCLLWSQYISIHAPHTGRDLAADNVHCVCNISIHAPHTGRDSEDPGNRPGILRISIHAPHTGRDPSAFSRLMMFHVFQSTRPIRGATTLLTKLAYKYKNFNPRAPYGARLSCFDLLFDIINISIHAPHTGRDQDMRQSA